MFNQMSLKGKLLLLSSTLAVGLLVVGATGSYTLSKVTKSSEHVANVNFANFRLIASMRYNATDLAKNYLRLLVPGTTAEVAAQVKKSIDENVENFSSANKAYLEVPFSAGEEELYKQEDLAWKSFLESAMKFVSLHGSKDQKDMEEYRELVSVRLPKLRVEHANALGKLLDFHTKESEFWIKQADDTAKKGTFFSWALTGACFIAAILFGLTLSSALAKTLREIATRLSRGADEVASASQQVSSSSEEISSSATEQAASLQETSASVEEMSAMISRNAENATHSQKVSSVSQAAAEKGKEAVTNMINSMGEIDSSNAEIMKQIEESNKNISEIVQVISEIGNKTKVINDIVFQTKLLSFNASVEAARAGEHGKGFAVVAEEVGNLAQMSGAAAKEISTMLEASIKKVEDIVTETKAKVESLARVGREKVSIGAETARQCGTVLDEIVNSIHEVSGMVSEISTASREQATGVSQINQAMGQLDQATQQNATASQQTASASEMLSLQANELRLMVKEMMRTIDGGAAGSAGGSPVMVTTKEKKEKKEKKVEKPASSNVVSMGEVIAEKTRRAKSSDGVIEVPDQDDARFKSV